MTLSCSQPRKQGGSTFEGSSGIKESPRELKEGRWLQEAQPKRYLDPEVWEDNNGKKERGNGRVKDMEGRK